jgi:uncharacterized protein YdaU (DUF1376 family)
MYAQDFDMATATWECEDIGIYIRLLNWSWVNGNLPDDLIKLAKIARISRRKLKKNWEFLSRKFLPAGEGFLQNRRLEEERSKKAKFIEQQRAKGIKSGEIRGNHGSTTVQPQLEPKGNLSFSSSFSSSSSTKKQKKQKITGTASVPLSVIIPDDIDPKIWGEFVKLRNKIKAPMTDRAVQMMFDELERLHEETGANKNDIIDQSIMNSWKGVFKLKEKEENTSVSTREDPVRDEDPWKGVKI